VAPVARIVPDETLFTPKTPLEPEIIYLGIVLLLSSSGRGLENGTDKRRTHCTLSPLTVVCVLAWAYYQSFEGDDAGRPLMCWA
jgi:hypothetical protein